MPGYQSLFSTGINSVCHVNISTSQTTPTGKHDRSRPREGDSVRCSGEGSQAKRHVQV